MAIATVSRDPAAAVRRSGGGEAAARAAGASSYSPDSANYRPPATTSNDTNKLVTEGGKPIIYTSGGQKYYKTVSGTKINIESGKPLDPNTPVSIISSTEQRTVYRTAGGGSRTIYNTREELAASTTPLHTTLGERLARRYFGLMGYETTKKGDLIEVEREGRKQVLGGIVTKQQKDTGVYYKEGSPRIIADIPTTAKYSSGFEGSLKKYDVTYKYDKTPGATISGLNKGTQYTSYKTDTIKLAGRDVTLITGKEYSYKKTFIDKTTRYLNLPNTYTQKLSYNISSKVYQAKNPAKAIGIGLGITAFSYGKGVIKGVTFPIREKFYSEEVPGLFKSSTYYNLGPSIKQNPEILAEMAGYAKGFSITSTFISRRILSPKVKEPTKTKIADRYLREAGVKESSGIKIERVGFFKYYIDKFKGSSMTTYIKPKKPKGYVTTKKWFTGEKYEAFLKTKPETARSQALKDLMTKSTKQPEATIKPPKTEITASIRPQTRTLPTDSSGALKYGGRFRSLRNRPRLVLVQENIYQPQSSVTGKTIIEYPSTFKLKATGIGLLGSKVLGSGVSTIKTKTNLTQLPATKLEFKALDKQGITQKALLKQELGLKSQQGLIQQTKQIGRSEQISRLNIITISDIKQAQTQQLGVKQLTETIQVQKQKLGLEEVPIPKVTLFEVGKPEYIKEFNFFKGKKIESIFKPKYFASVEATAFNIRGPKPSKKSIATGLNIRPIAL